MVGGGLLPRKVVSGLIVARKWSGSYRQIQDDTILLRVLKWSYMAFTVPEGPKITRLGLV